MSVAQLHDLSIRSKTGGPTSLRVLRLIYEALGPYFKSLDVEQKSIPIPTAVLSDIEKQCLSVQAIQKRKRKHDEVTTGKQKKKPKRASSLFSIESLCESSKTTTTTIATTSSSSASDSKGSSLVEWKPSSPKKEAYTCHDGPTSLLSQELFGPSHNGIRDEQEDEF